MVAFFFVTVFFIVAGIAWEALVPTEKPSYVPPPQVQVVSDPLLPKKQAFEAKLQSHKLSLFTTMRDQVVSVFGGCKSAVEMMEDHDLIFTVQLTDEQTDEFWERSTEEEKKRVAAMLLLLFGKELERRGLLDGDYPVNVGVTVDPGLSLTRRRYKRAVPIETMLETVHAQ